MKRMKRDVRETRVQTGPNTSAAVPRTVPAWDQNHQSPTRTTRILPVPPESYQNHQSYQNQPTLGRRSNKSRRELVTQAEMDLFIFLGRQTTVDSPNWTEPTLTRKELAGVTTETAQSTRFGPLSPGPIVSPVAEGGQAC